VRYAVRHVTRYRYADSVSNSQHDLHVLPRELPWQRCLSAQLAISPTPIVCRERVDYFGNRATHVVLATPHTEMIATAESLVEVSAPETRVADDDLPWQEAARVVVPGDDLQVQEMRFPSPFVEPWPALRDFALRSFPSGRPLLVGCIDLMARIHGDFAYDPRATTVATPLEQVFEQRRGVCQDFAHLMIACLRSLGLPARYVSGYLMTLPPPGQPRLQGADASHAWLAVHSRRFGFVDLDPTNNCLVGDAHVTLAVGRDFGDVTPLRGVIHGGSRHDLQVAVDVVPQPESGTDGAAAPCSPSTE
jgi:transglutaminase-like putative cysteine protease